MRRICWSFSADRRSIRAALVATLAVFGGCGAPAKQDERLLTLGADCFRIPAASLAYFNAESGRSAALLFANADVREKVPGYAIPPAMPNGMRDTFYVSVLVPTELAVARIRADEKASREKTYYDLWYALDEFAGRIVEPVDGTVLYRVRPLADGPTWMVVSRPPNSSRRDAHLATDFWIATCADTDGARLTRCTARVEESGVWMTLYTTEANLALREPLARYVIDAMKPWKVACGSGAH
jgi:hypothetical protein